MTEDLQIRVLIERLERAAQRLRGAELSADEAAELVEECASLAMRAGAELERRARGSGGALAAMPTGNQDPLTGPRQDRLL